MDAERDLHLGHGRMKETPYRPPIPEEPPDDRVNKMLLLFVIAVIDVHRSASDSCVC